MRFFLDSAAPADIAACARLPFAAGVTTNPGLLARAGLKRHRELLEAVAAAGRRDWKLWLQLPEAPAQETVAAAERASDALAALTGGPLAGPTLVAKLVPTTQAIFAASVLGQRGIEVCVTGIASPLQGAAILGIPAGVHVDDPPGSVRTEGPPASRRPFAVDHIACYVGRIDDSGRDGIQALLDIARLLDGHAVRTRILAGSVRSPQVLSRIVDGVVATGTARVDVALPFRLLESVLDDPVTAAALLEVRRLPALDL